LTSEANDGDEGVHHEQLVVARQRKTSASLSRAGGASISRLPGTSAAGLGEPRRIPERADLAACLVARAGAPVEASKEGGSGKAFFIIDASPSWASATGGPEGEAVGAPRHVSPQVARQEQADDNRVRADHPPRGRAGREKARSTWITAEPADQSQDQRPPGHPGPAASAEPGRPNQGVRDHEPNTRAARPPGRCAASAVRG